MLAFVLTGACEERASQAPKAAGGPPPSPPQMHTEIIRPPVSSAVIGTPMFAERSTGGTTDGDRFPSYQDSRVRAAAEHRVSTFSIDVDTGSYSFVRAALNRGHLPDPDAVRVEELVNYFPYAYPAASERGKPFAATVSVAATPWNAGTKLLHIGIKGYELGNSGRPRANLVFLIDTSGSMDEPNRLPLVVQSLKVLLGNLDPKDRVAVVTYASEVGTALEPTPVAERSKILAVLDSLQAGGSTAGGAGLTEAYRLAESDYIEGGLNRVILATDGDFNVGMTDTAVLKGFVAARRSKGVYLSVLGFGMGNYHDSLMQALAQNGNGNAAYIDTLREARKVLEQEATSVMFPIAKDVKIEVEFNPHTVSEYRLIGYESRLLARDDFRNDKVDAGEIGAGHTVTALYEITPAGSGAALVGSLRYRPQGGPPAGVSDEYACVKIRYKLPDSETSTEITRVVGPDDELPRLGALSQETRFSAAVAGFGQLLRGGTYTGDFDFGDVIDLAQGAQGADHFGYRREFIELVRAARTVADLDL